MMAAKAPRIQTSIRSIAPSSRISRRRSPRLRRERGGGGGSRSARWGGPAVARGAGSRERRLLQVRPGRTEVAAAVRHPLVVLGAEDAAGRGRQNGVDTPRAAEAERGDHARAGEQDVAQTEI